MSVGQAIDKVILFGGTFDPPHKGHIECAKAIIKQMSKTIVVFMPSNLTPDKSKSVVSGKCRLEMIKLGIYGTHRCLVDDFEINKEGMSYTYLTLEYLKQKFHGISLYFLIGSDRVSTLKDWVNVDQILDMAYPLIVSRLGFKLPTNEVLKDIHGTIFCLDSLDQYQISSTEIRNRLKLFGISDRLVQSALPSLVLDYIQKNSLYITPALTTV